MSDFLRQSGGVAVIDSGLARELERHGADLDDPLWSAKCLLTSPHLTSPHLIQTVHLDYLEAGADIIITACYQATIQGFEAKWFSQRESETLLKRSVEVAREARDISYDRYREFSPDGTSDGRVLKHRSILVAASVGSYGAYLADGSEYRLMLRFLRKKTKIPGWFSFNSKDGVHVVSGDSLLECTALAEACKKVIAVGINCTPPRFIHDLIFSIKRVTTKPILIYPNSGESYDADQKEWVQNTGVSDKDFVSYVNTWCEVGASLVGGCCRTTPNTMRAIYRTLSNRSAALSLE